MRHLWKLLLLMTVSSLAEHSALYGDSGGGPFWSTGGNGGPFGQGRDILIRGRGSGGPFTTNFNHEDIIAGSQSGGPFGSRAEGGLINGGSNGGRLGQEINGLIRGSGSGGPFRINFNQEDIIAGSQSGGPFGSTGSMAEGGLINGGTNRGPFGQERDSLIRGSGGPFRANVNQEGIAAGSQSGGPFGNQVRDGVKNGEGSGGPFGQGRGGLIRSNISGGPFRIKVDKDDFISDSQSGVPFGNTGYLPADGLVNGYNNGGPFGLGKFRLIRGSDVSGSLKPTGELEGIIYGSQDGGPFREQAGKGLVHGGNTGGPFRESYGGEGITSGGSTKPFDNQPAPGLIMGGRLRGPLQ